MTKIIQKISNSKEPKKEVKNTLSLDKLAQLVPDQNTKSSETLRKRAKAKYFTNSYTSQLAGLKSELQKSYNNTVFGCSNLLIQSENKITGKYCGNRWCIVCNRIRTAKMITGYKPVLENLKEKYFVTLTIPNVEGNVLKGTIQNMTKTFQLIQKCFRKEKIKLFGLRKLEVTYNPVFNNFHPHFHFIISGKNVSEMLVNAWLKRFPTANIKAQDIRQADDRSVMELFKYFSKIITGKNVYIQALDKIFVSMKNLRVYQPFGIKKVSEDIEEIQAEVYEDLLKAEKIWTWLENDWIDKITGECLTGYVPDQDIKDLIKNIR